MIENIDTIINVIFGACLIIYITHKIISNNSNKLEESLFRSIRSIADSAKIGEAPETTIKRISEMKSEKCSKVYKKILNQMNDGKSFADAINNISSKTQSPLLKYLSPILIAAQETGVDVYDILNKYSSDLWKLKYQEDYVKNSLISNFIVLKIIAVIILPATFYYFPMILEEVIFEPYIFYFFSAFAGIIGLLDLVVYNDKSSFILIPFYSSFAYIIPKILVKTPVLIEFIKGLI